jgi:hypothetical protein
MSADRDSRIPPGPEPGDDFEDDDAPQSIFAATWFRVVLVLAVVAIAGALAVPYVLDAVNPPVTPVIAVTNPRAVSGTAPATPSPKAPASTLAQAPAAAPAPTTGAPPSASAPPAATAPAKPRETTAAPTMPKPSASTEAAKPAVPAKELEKATTMPPVTKAERPAPPSAAAGDRGAATRPAPARASAAEGGDYFVQVGAFKDASIAKRVAATLRAQNYPVEESVKRVSGATVAEAPRPAPRAPATTSSGADRYDVIVTGGTPAEINTKLAAKGLAVEPAGDGVRIRPSLPLRDAVALSKDLNNDGFKVQVRRGGAPVTTTPAPVRPPAVSDADGGGDTLHRVRVGGYPDRATAQGVLRALQGKGYQPFIAKGRE